MMTKRLKLDMDYLSPVEHVECAGYSVPDVMYWVKRMMDKEAQLELNWFERSTSTAIKLCLRKGRAIPDFHKNEVEGSVWGVQAAVSVFMDQSLVVCGRCNNSVRFPNEMDPDSDVTVDFTTDSFPNLHNDKVISVTVHTCGTIAVHAYNFVSHRPEEYVICGPRLTGGALWTTPRRFPMDAVSPYDHAMEWSHNRVESEEDQALTREAALLAPAAPCDTDADTDTDDDVDCDNDDCDCELMNVYTE